jgi:hypothetical protein
MARILFAHHGSPGGRIINRLENGIFLVHVEFIHEITLERLQEMGFDPQYWCDLQGQNIYIMGEVEPRFTPDPERHKQLEEARKNRKGYTDPMVSNYIRRMEKREKWGKILVLIASAAMLAYIIKTIIRHL